MKKDVKKLSREISFPAWEAVTKEFVRLPRRSSDIAFSHVYEPSAEESARHGNLYVIGHIEDAAQAERTLCNAIALEGRKIYYHSEETSSEERFQKTLQHLNAYIRSYAEQFGVGLNPTRFHISILALSGETLMVSEFGSVFSYLIRGTGVVEISKKAASQAAMPTGGFFTHFVRGTLLQGDIVFAATPHSIRPDTLQDFGGEPEILGPLKNIMEHLASHADDADDTHASAALIITCAQANSRRYNVYTPAAPSRHALPPPGASSSPIETVLKNMFMQRRSETAESPFPKEAAMAKKFLKAAVRHWYAYPLIAAALLIGNGFSSVFDAHTETNSHTAFNEFLGDVLEHARTAVHTDISSTQKRALFAALLKVVEPSAENAPDAHQTALQLERGIRRIDRETIPETPAPLVDFEKLSVVFQPESLHAGTDGSYTVAERSLVQFVRLSPPDTTPRLIITGLGNLGPVYASMRTQEPTDRFAFLLKDAVFVADPGTRIYVQQRIASASQKLVSANVLFAAGAREFFVVSPKGRISRAPLAANRQTSLRTLLLPKQFQTIAWRGATLLGSSLYLLSSDARIIRLAGEKIVSDYPVGLAEPLGSTVQLRTLEKSRRLVILDGEHKRIILTTLQGTLVRQYRHELFTDLRDALEGEKNTLLILTRTHLLRISTSD